MLLNYNAETKYTRESTKMFHQMVAKPFFYLHISGSITQYNALEVNKRGGWGFVRSSCSSSECKGRANCTGRHMSCQARFISLHNSSLKALHMRGKCGSLSEPSLKNHYHLSSLPDLSLSKPGVQLAPKSSQPSINRSIKPSICLYFLYFKVFRKMSHH